MPILPKGKNTGVVGQYTGTVKATPAPKFGIEIRTIKDHMKEGWNLQILLVAPSVFNVSQDGKVTM